MKQVSLFSNQQEEKKKYTSKIEAPIYEPKNKQPHILELCNKQKTKRLINEINDSNVSAEEKKFLIDAANRHNVFNYEKIADYYAHASKEMQYLMEHSALVIIDFEKAIEYGYVKLCEDIKNQYLTEYKKENLYYELKDLGIIDDMSAYENFEDFYKYFEGYKENILKEHGEVVEKLSREYLKQELKNIFDNNLYG